MSKIISLLDPLLFLMKEAIDGYMIKNSSLVLKNYIKHMPDQIIEHNKAKFIYEVI